MSDLWQRAEAALSGEGGSHIAGHPARVAAAAREVAPGTYDWAARTSSET